MDTHYYITSNCLLLVIGQHVNVVVALAMHTQQYHNAPHSKMDRPLSILKALHYSINASAARGRYFGAVEALSKDSTFGVCCGRYYQHSYDIRQLPFY